YQYGYKFNAQRMNKQKILLPITPNHKPDWAYMEHSMKLIEVRKILKIIQYYNQSNLIKHGIV
ncbi:MAG: hypothetical protein Q4C68_06505, partial [Moraxella sp.]|nr:hypothetical protein [Moraxella sp.]